MRTRIASAAGLPDESQRRVLVVSTGFVGRIVQVSLERAGHSVAIASDPQAALERLGDAVPDLLVIDLDLPELADGLALLRRIRRLYPPAALPIAMLGDACDGEIVAQACSAGADFGLTKPFDPAALTRFLNSRGR
ncbi:MAG: response regulator [Armatimonadota bacterium]